MKVIELSVEDFEKLTKNLKQCEEDRKKLKTANHYLNEQIKVYNEKFAKNDNEK